MATSSVNQSKIVIPTGFESQQRQLERKQAIAQALLERGMAGPGANATSWTQPLASVVQALVGKHLQNRADKQQGELDTTIKNAYAGKVGQVQQDILDAGNSPEALQQVWFKYQSDPLVADIIKPIAERVGHMQQNGDTLSEHGGILAPNRDFATNSGGVLPSDPVHDKLIKDPATGRLVPNPGLVEFDAQAQGLTPEGGTGFPGMPDTRQGVVQAMMANRAGAPAGYPGAPQQGVAAPVDSGGELPALPGGAPPMPQQVPPPFSHIQGKPVWFINGKLYDNPEGK